MSNTIIRNARMINRGKAIEGELYIRDGRFVAQGAIPHGAAIHEIDAKGSLVIPGIIDDQVHFREPGLTHKADIGTEARAAVAGGVTSYMEMPNTKPAALTRALLEEKYAIANRTSLANYSFFMGVSNDNADEALRIDPSQVCGLKIFMGSSTGNMLVDDTSTLSRVFSESPTLIATHCEDEKTVLANQEKWMQKYGNKLSAKHHPAIRSVKACVISSSLAIQLARKFDTRLHILHISTQNEIPFFDNQTPIDQKKITSEVCVHHLYFHSGDYAKLGNLIKCNPAIKSKSHRDALRKGLIDGYFDVIATDHAPHTWDEKMQPYSQAPSGLPLVQHSLQIMLDFVREGWISLETVVHRMCHAPAIAFKIADRGYLDEGCFADLCIVDQNATQKVTKENLYYKCAWSPLEGKTFNSRVLTTMVNGNVVFDRGHFFEETKGARLSFNRK